MYKSNFIFFVLTKNPIKIIALILLIISSHFCYISDPIVVKFQILNEIPFYGKNNYTVVDNSNNTLSIKSYDSKPETILENGYKYVIEQKTSNTRQVTTLFIVLLSVFLLLSSLIPERDFNWNFDEYLMDRIKSRIKCEFENDEYFYFYKNRLVRKSKSILSRYDIDSVVDDIYTAKNINVYPIYQTKKMKRKSNINNILT